MPPPWRGATMSWVRAYFAPVVSGTPAVWFLIAGRTRGGSFGCPRAIGVGWIDANPGGCRPCAGGTPAAWFLKRLA